MLAVQVRGAQVVTIEGLEKDGQMHPVQAAFRESHSFQCGFCTPGFVMSLYAAYLGEPKPDAGRINDILAGNLCRCTGYGPIVHAAQAMYDAPRPAAEQAALARERRQLEGIRHTETICLEDGGRRFFSPATLQELARLCEENPQATILSGATDVGLWITKLHRDIATFIHVGRVRELQTMTRQGDTLRIGAGATWSDLEEALGTHYPDFGELLRRFGAVQVRNAATIGGNIANGSPIGDGAPALIALGARLVLREGATTRTIPLESFFVSYGKQDRAAGEFVEAVEVPILDRPERLKCYKISKRFDQDISAVCGCFNIEVAGGSVSQARICYGGMAGTPKRAAAVEAALTGRPWTLATVTAALPAFERDYSPLTDMRGSAGYRMQVARNLLLKYFHETQRPLHETRLVGREAAFG
jgi:xanthine dehydrogenase small subunit